VMNDMFVFNNVRPFVPAYRENPPGAEGFIALYFRERNLEGVEKMPKKPSPLQQAILETLDMNIGKTVAEIQAQLSVGYNAGHIANALQALRRRELARPRIRRGTSTVEWFLAAAKSTTPTK